MTDQAVEDDWAEQHRVVARARQRYQERHYAETLRGFQGTATISFYETPTTDEHNVMTIGEWGGYLIQIMPMIFNDRLVMTPKAAPSLYDHGWCFDKGGAAYLAALVWDPQEQAEPAGYKKRATRGLRTAGSDASEQAAADEALAWTFADMLERHTR